MMDEPLDLSMKPADKDEILDDSNCWESHGRVSNNALERHRDFLAGLSNERELCRCERNVEQDKRPVVNVERNTNTTDNCQIDFSCKTVESKRYCKRRAGECDSIHNDHPARLNMDYSFSQSLARELNSPRGDASSDVSRDSMLLESPDQQSYYKGNNLTLVPNTTPRGNTDAEHLTRLLQSPPTAFSDAGALGRSSHSALTHEASRKISSDHVSQSKVTSEHDAATKFECESQTPENLRIPALDFLMLQFFCQKRDDPIIPINNALKERIRSGEKKKISMVDLMELQVEACLLHVKT